MIYKVEKIIKNDISNEEFIEIYLERKTKRVIENV